MTLWAWIGAAFILAAVVEFLLFRFVLAEQAGIKRNLRLLMINCVFNATIGIAFLIIAEASRRW